MQKLFKAAVLLFSLFILSFSSDNPIKIKIDKDTLKTGEIFKYEVEINGQFKSPKLTLPEFENFKIASQSQTKRYVFEGQETELIVNFTYFLFAEEPGTFTIDPVIIEDQDQKYKSDEITITVEGQSLKEKNKFFPYDIERGVDI